MLKSRLKFVTYFSKTYIVQGLTAIDSILLHHPESAVLIYALDKQTETTVLRKYSTESRVTVIQSEKLLITFENYMRSGRSFSESVFSIKPLVIKTALERVRPKDFLFYFDADMFFFKSIIIEDDLFREYSVYLSKHIFRSSLESHSKYGVMNAGFVGFQKNDIGRDALDWWLARCNEECSIRSDGETYADQKYLEVIPKLFEDCKVFADLGINQGMWAMQHDFAIEKGPRINGCEITCFHFHGLRVYRRYFAFTDLYRYGRNGSEGDISKFIYSPYFRQLEVNYEFGRRYLPDNFPSIRQLLKPGSIHFLIRKRFTCGSSGILFS